MSDLIMTRFAYAPFGVYAVLPVAGANLYTVERPWLDNKPGISCIPEGVFDCEIAHFFRGDYDAYEIKNVPGRTHILMHIANKPNEVIGCVGLGSGMGCFDGGGILGVTASENAFKYFMAKQGRAPFKLTITHTPLPSTGVLS